MRPPFRGLGAVALAAGVLGSGPWMGRPVRAYRRDGQEVVETWRSRPNQGDWPTDAGTD